MKVGGHPRIALQNRAVPGLILSGRWEMPGIGVADVWSNTVWSLGAAWLDGWETPDCWPTGTP